MTTINELIKPHPFFQGISQEYIDLIAGCGKNETYNEGDFIARDGERADHFYLIREGVVLITIPSSGGKPHVIQTCQKGDILGWAWLFEPYQWMFDLVVQKNARVVALDGTCLRAKFEKEPQLGYTMMRRFAQLMIERLKETRLLLSDVYK